MSKKCDYCGSEMELKETKLVGSTTYKMWYCSKCKKKVAKTA